MKKLLCIFLSILLVLPLISCSTHKIDIQEGCQNFAERLPANERQRRIMADVYAKERNFNADECYQLMCKHNKETQ